MQCRGGLVLISGEAGVGKTRFTAEVLRETERYGPLVLWGAGCGLEGHFPYGPFVEALESYLRRLPLVECQLLSESYPDLQLLLPSFQKPSISPTHRASTARRSSATCAAHCSARWSDCWMNSSEQTPLVLVLDDLQGADVESLHLLHHLARLAPERRWLVLANYREEDVPADSELQRLVAEMTRADLCRRIRLLRLGREECNRLVQSFLPDGDVAPELLDHLYAIRAVIRSSYGRSSPSCASEGSSSSRIGIWQFRGDVEIGVPEQVRRADPGAGRPPAAGHTPNSGHRRRSRAFEFTFADIRAGTVVAGTPGKRADALVLDALDHALSVRLLEEDERGYTFSHPLARASLYERLSRHRCTHLHGVLARAIEKQRAERRGDHRVPLRTFRLVR